MQKNIQIKHVTHKYYFNNLYMWQPGIKSNVTFACISQQLRTFKKQIIQTQMQNHFKINAIYANGIGVKLRLSIRCFIKFIVKKPTNKHAQKIFKTAVT